MARTPDLGSTDDEAHRAAFDLGYEAFDGYEPSDFIDADDLDTDIETAVEELGLSHFESVTVAVSESAANRRLWRALEDYYDAHKPEDVAEQFHREAAVAEDFDTSFSAGAYAAIRGDDPDPEEHIDLFLNDDAE